MAIQLISIKCPECGADLSVEAGRAFLFCSYCGRKVIISSDTPYSEVVFRTVDEAGIKEAETERILKLKRMEMIEKHRTSKEEHKKISLALRIVLSVILVPIALFTIVYGLLPPGNDMALIIGLIICGILVLVWFMGSDDSDGGDDELNFEDRAKIPEGVRNYFGKNYSAIESMLSGAGFNNIQCVPLKDLTIGLFSKPGMVDTITIHGQIIDSDKRYFKDAPIIISYHSYADRR